MESTTMQPPAAYEPAESFLSADAILTAQDHTYAVVECAEWGGKVRVRSLSGDERAELEGKLAAGKDGKGAAAAMKGLREKVVFDCAVDRNGARLFATPAHMEGLRKKNAAPLSRIFEKVLDISGMTADDKKRIEAELDANPSEPGPSA